MLSQTEDLYKVSVASSVTVADLIEESCNEYSVSLKVRFGRHVSVATLSKDNRLILMQHHSIFDVVAQSSR